MAPGTETAAITGGTDNRRARPRAPVVITDGGQTGVCPGSNHRTVMMADGDDGGLAPMAYGTDNRRCTGRERPAYNQAPRWGECAEGGSPWQSHTGVAVPNRAHEFVPEGRLRIGRPFTTCATTCPVPVPVSSFPPYAHSVRRTPGNSRCCRPPQERLLRAWRATHAWQEPVMTLARTATTAPARQICPGLT